jgi:hypothetical protein
VGCLDHVIAGHLHNIGAPIELLRLVFEKIGAGEGVAIGFDKTAARVSRNRRIAPAEFLARMLGAEARRQRSRRTARVLASSASRAGTR